MKPFYFYLARCADGSLYAGSCADLKARENKHNDGTASKYTRARRPITFVYHELCKNRSEACKRETEVKRWPKLLKEKLVAPKKRSK